MNKARKVAILVVVLALAGQAFSQSGQVKFRGTVTADEDHDVVPVCYGDYHVTVAIDAVLDDPNGALAAVSSVQVCYEDPLKLATGNAVEVNGYYWGDGSCPKQYCWRVQILLASDYVRLLEAYGDNDWMVKGDNLYALPDGNVGIGTSEPRDKLHVAGNVLVEGDPSACVRIQGTLGNDAGICMTTTGVGVNTWEIQRQGASADLRIAERFPYPPFSNNPVVVKARTGYVGLGDDDPQYRLELPNTADPAGQARANAWWTYSSGRWKSDVQTIEHAMDKVRQLRGVSFDWKSTGAHDIGMIAEEVGRVVPEVVDYEANGTDARGLAYDRLVALLVEALKEQDARIDELEKALAERDQLEQRLQALERLVQQQSATVPAVQTQP